MYKVVLFPVGLNYNLQSMFHSLSVALRPWPLVCLLSGGLLAVAHGQAFHTALAGATAISPVLPPVAPPVAPETLFSQMVIFGDSLSDTGNFADTTEAAYGVRYPSTAFNYADGRFTDGTGTAPAAKKYTGVWHEQLAAFFLGMTPATASRGGGTDYAFGDAETLDGQRTVDLQAGLPLQVDNMGQQVTNYLNALGGNAADPAALFIVWGGSNDLFADDSAANVTAAAQRETALIQRLAEAGASTFLVPNLPPLGQTPEYIGDSAQSPALNRAAASFRDQLNADLDALETTLAAEGLTVKIYRLDLYTLFGSLNADDGADYGFTETTSSAQGGTGKPDQSLFWDDVHPTTYGHFQIAAQAYTLLTGTPVVEVSQVSKYVDRSVGGTGAFLLTRTGTDLSQTLTVPYLVSGTAVAGTDYTVLKGQKKIKAGRRTVKINLDPTDAPANSGTVKVKLTIQAGTGYTLPAVKSGAINLQTVPPPR